MRKVLLIIFFLVVIIAGVGYLAYDNAATILAKIIAHKTHVAVTIDSIDFKKEEFTIHDFQMANPKGTRLPTALRVQTIDVKAAYKRYFENPIEINEIHLDNVYVNIQIYDKDQTRGNWQTIMGNIDHDNKSPLSVEREAIIRRLLLTNIRIDLILSDGKLHQLSPIERLEFNDITSERGIPTQEIAEIIVQKMMHQIFLEKGLKTIIEAPVDVIKGFFPFFGHLLEDDE
ncbi:hypothetical protein [Simkania sp.]|uniref:hypothetical protein n=1 Tax=Simkania sp. TaxID=34094 RepID=UPI003B52F8B5